ncbi:hypothetical protein niasHT_025076 [Heterodera trifolii]|uniref:J domain-containing protein n=1 Tax=Heterodera trifolii TaxID=157864 RepID=A0ABD2K0Z0_9BILA
MFSSSRKNNINSINYEKLLPHEWLCVRQNATPEEINQNYRKFVRVIHPDKNNQCSDKLFMLITNAKDVLLGHSENSSSMMDELLPHEWLCVRQNATPEEINENYRKLVRVIHPDKN